MEASKERKIKMKNAMSINDMEKEFGSVEFEGAKYILIQDAYLSNRDRYGDAAYFANAIKVGDTPDDGYVPLYTVEWEITNSETAEIIVTGPAGHCRATSSGMPVKAMMHLLP